MFFVVTVLFLASMVEKKIGQKKSYLIKYIRVTKLQVAELRVKRKRRSDSQEVLSGQGRVKSRK